MTRKHDNTRGRNVTRREFMGGAAVLGAGLLAAGGAGRALASMAPIPKDAVAQNAVLTTGDSGAFKILQVTDCHMHFVAKGYLGDPKKIEAVQAMVDAFKPDMIMNTGDFWANVTEPGRADSCKELCKLFGKLGVPWAYAWGNHDESTDYDRTHKLLETAPNSLYRGAAGDGNYRIEVRTPGGSAPVWNLIVLNNSRGGFKPEQIDWFNAEAARIRAQTPAPPPAILFFHIPVPQYDDVAAPGKAVGVKFEKVCHEDGSREALPAFQAAGFVKAMFVGHDHVNDYYGELGGVRLQYGRALGGYGEDKVRKGGTLISVNPAAGTFETKSVFPDGTSKTFDTFTDVPAPGTVY